MTTSHDESLLGDDLTVRPPIITIPPIDPPVIIPAPAIVAAPTNLQAAAAAGKVTLTWQDNSNNEDGFRIRRRAANEADFSDVAQVGPNVTTYADTTVQPQTTYTYRVRSFRSGGGGAVSNDVTITTPAAATSQRRALSDAARANSRTVTAGSSISFVAGQFMYEVGGIRTLEFVNASASVVPAEPTTRVSLFPKNPIETYQDVTVTFRTEVDTPARPYDVVISGQSTEVRGPEGAYAPVAYRVDVQPAPVVTLSVAPKNRTIRAGASATYDITLQREPMAEGVRVELELSDRNLPPGVTAVFDPPRPSGNTAKLTVITDRNLLPPDMQEIELRIRGTGQTVKVLPATARLRLQPEAAFTAVPATATVTRGATKTFRFIATRMFYPNGQLQLELSVNGTRPFTPTIRPAGFSSAAEFEVDIEVDDDAQPGRYTFVATPRFPAEVKNGVPMGATVELVVEDTAAVPVTVALSDTAITLTPGSDEEIVIGIQSPREFAGKVDVSLDTNGLPFGVRVSRTRLTLERFGGDQTFDVIASEEASGEGILRVNATVNGMPVTVVPNPDVRVSVPVTESVTVKLVNAIPVNMGEPAFYAIEIRSVGYAGKVRASAVTEGPVTFTANDIPLSPGQTGRIELQVDTTQVSPGMYTFDVFVETEPQVPIIGLPLKARLVVDPNNDRIPLPAPSNLRATLQGPQINLRWNDNSQEEGFRIERRSMNGAYQVIATVARGTTSFADASVTAGATYFYRVKAFAGAAESLPSNEIGVAVPLPQPAAAAVRLSAAPASQRIVPGGVASFSVALSRTSYAGPVDLTVDGLPFGAIATFSDDPATGNSSILTVATEATSPGLYRLNVRGTAPDVTVEPASIALNVAPARVPGPLPRPIPGRDLRPGFAAPDPEA